MRGDDVQNNEMKRCVVVKRVFDFFIIFSLTLLTWSCYFVRNHYASIGICNSTDLVMLPASASVACYLVTHHCTPIILIIALWSSDDTLKIPKSYQRIDENITSLEPLVIIALIRCTLTSISVNLAILIGVIFAHGGHLIITVQSYYITSQSYEELILLLDDVNA